MQSFAIPDYGAVKRIKGSIGEGGFALHKLNFCKKDGSEITKVELNNDKPYGPEFLIDDYEEIIGIYGTKNGVHDRINQLGFIVWKFKGLINKQL